MASSPSTILSVDFMSPPPDFVAHLLARLGRVRELLGLEATTMDASSRFADALDSMGFVEFLALTADDCGVPVDVIEEAAGRRYGTVAELATAMHTVGLRLVSRPPATPITPTKGFAATQPKAWLAGTMVRLPNCIQPAAALDALLHRPTGWLEEHAGIRARGVWGDEDALDAAANVAASSLPHAGLSLDRIGALLVTSQAPPLLTGLAAALHHRLGLSSEVAAIEIGGACTGFLAAMWTGQRLLVDRGAVLIVSVEAPSHWLSVQPGPAGEAAALFGDAAAACVLTAQRTNDAALLLRDITLGVDGASGSLLRVQHEPGYGTTLQMNGVALTERAVRTMADAVQQMCRGHGLTVDQLVAIVAHGGNGRIPALLARRLHLPLECVWSETARTGNLGSASLPVAFVSHIEALQSPFIWTTIGAGLQWGAALFENWSEPTA